MIHDKIVIFDFGSQYTQLIARKLRELNHYCEIVPYTTNIDVIEDAKGVILSGSPCSVNDIDAPQIDLDHILKTKPVLGVCYGAQYMAQQLGGVLSNSDHREYGRALLENTTESDLTKGMSEKSTVWMSHGDTITTLPEGLEVLAKTDTIPVAAFSFTHYPMAFGIQFHPEVYHSDEGLTLLRNFCSTICQAKADWTPGAFVSETVAELKNQLGNDKVILGLSGGVDSSVAALLLSKAIGDNLHCIFINNGLLRHNEYDEVLEAYKSLNLNVKGVDSSSLFYDALIGESDPEGKRKIIGKIFVDVFDEEAKMVQNANWLAQGTIYPDVIESVSVKGPSATIKSHHNVGGLPDHMNLKVVEPLRNLFKDEVRRVGAEMELPKNILNRHPFPGPGLGIRILGDVNEEKVKMLQLADAIYINNLKETGWYDKIWQAGAILLPVKSVGVMGDERSYEQTIALRAVASTDGMTADWVHIPYELLGKISNEIINKVRGVNRVVYDISSKPPATIEWE
ncbi:MAG: glutamine-hydrolyzing GMP synthase [Bacteroidia bacterium]|nr:glutamine-hydrolyzing GMP synthase [Bacteroidia bacterium]